MTAGEDCVVLGLESFSVGLSVQVAGNTVYAHMHARAGAFEVASLKCPCSALVLPYIIYMF
jgi:hypothetical protein